MEPQSTRELLARYGVPLKKSLGQNFLVDARVPRRTAEAALDGAAGFGALEIGAGAGALTRELAARAERVVAVELDSRMLPILGETLSEFSNVELVEGDATALDLGALVDDKLRGLRAVAAANLPYYLTTPLIERLLGCRRFERVCVMVQREVAERIVAKPGGKDYGSFSVYCRYYAEPKILFGVPPSAFYPQPQVSSAVVLLDCRSGRPDGVASAEDEARLFKLTRCAFGERRKKLAGLAARAFDVSRETVERAMADCGISPDARGETLSLEDFIALSNSLKA